MKIKINIGYEKNIKIAEAIIDNYEGYSLTSNNLFREVFGITDENYSGYFEGDRIWFSDIKLYQEEYSKLFTKNYGEYEEMIKNADIEGLKKFFTESKRNIDKFLKEKNSMKIIEFEL